MTTYCENDKLLESKDADDAQMKLREVFQREVTDLDLTASPNSDNRDHYKSNLTQVAWVAFQGGYRASPVEPSQAGVIGYISAECLAKLNDPAWQELRGTPVNLWTINNPPSRAQIPVYASNPTPKGYDKSEMNAFVQSLYDTKIAEGRHGHYETMFHVVHQAIKRAQPVQALEPLDESEAELALRSLASWLGVGGYNAPKVDAKVFEQKIRDGVEMLTKQPSQARELSRDELTDLIAAGLGCTYHCTRVWSAWGVGTMSQDDFGPVDESDTPAEIADAIIAAINAKGAA